MNLKRIRKLNGSAGKKGPAVYWMSRDQRVDDNWALIYAAETAAKENTELVVAFCLVPEFLGSEIRQYGFMLKGLREVESRLKDLDIAFQILTGEPEIKIPGFVKEASAGCLVTDFDPLRIKRKWKEKISARINIPFYEADAHNIVPAFAVSSKEEFAAYTIRPKIKKLLPEFLDEFPRLDEMKYKKKVYNERTNWEKLNGFPENGNSVPEVSGIIPGENSAQAALKEFIFNGLKGYGVNRNDPVIKAQSGLSPYLHFGHIAPQRVALNVEKHCPEGDDKALFLEELIIRRELSDNFCLYNPNYDAFEGFGEWAKITLSEHRRDRRKYIYSLKEFEFSNTHEDLWNAAQNELRNKGKVHGYMRMYWAKKILEWSASPEKAMRIAVYLNDKYSLDGRDPNGYAGCAWAIGGIHDRPWAEREIYGKIRYMNESGCRRKFDVDAYVNNNRP